MAAHGGPGRPQLRLAIVRGPVRLRTGEDGRLAIMDGDALRIAARIQPRVALAAGSVGRYTVPVTGVDPPSDETLLAALRSALFASEPDDLIALYLFGSAAGGPLRDDSDLDLAFLARSPIDPVRVFDAAQAVAAALGRDVDLLDLAHASTVMRAQVIVRGRLVFAADRTALDTFEMYAFSDYARLQEERAGVLRAFEAAYDV